MNGQQYGRRRAENRQPRRAPLSSRGPVVLIAVLMAVAVAGAMAGGYVWGRAAYARQQRLLLSADRYYCPVDAAMLTVQVVPLVAESSSGSVIERGNSAAGRCAAELLSRSGLGLACERVKEVYGLDCVVGTALTIPREFFDDERQQYRVDMILHWLTGRCDPRAFRTIGVMDRDVYAPGFNFLFGQSTLGGNCCVAACARMPLMDEYSEELALERWHSIVVHELGHALGLQHNEDWQSVMAFGNSLTELDRQGTGLLKSDWRLLREIHPIRWHRRLRGQQVVER